MQSQIKSRSQPLNSSIITTTDIRAFEQDGYFIPSNRIFTDELIENALYGVQQFYEGERDFDLPISGGYLDWRPEHGGNLHINDYVSLQNIQLQELRDHQPLAEIATRLLQCAGVRLFHDQLITKRPSSDASTIVGWHTDQAYWHTCTSNNLITAWIPLTEPSPNSGGLCVIKGSHEWDNTDELATFGMQELASLENRLRKSHPDYEIVPLHVPLGHASFHHARTIHGSYPNESEMPRTALTIHFQDIENRYRPVSEREPSRPIHINDLLCVPGEDGYPDYTDAEICPLLWREEEGG